MSDLRHNRLNMIYFVCHDLGTELGCYGKPIETPNLDAFARQGARMSRMFCNSPACSPSRCCAYTGMYAHTNGAMGLAHLGWPLDEKVKTIVDYFNEAGYETVHAGMQHERVSREENRYQVYLSSGARDGGSGRSSGAVEDAVEQAVAYLKSRDPSAKPFYLNIGTYEVHASMWQDQDNGRRKEVYGTTPFDRVHMPGYIPDTPELRKEMANFQACIRYLDKYFKLLTVAINDLGYEKNTLVVFTTDHGISNVGAKGTLYDRGVEITFLARLPGVIREGLVVEDLMQNIDVAPTLLDAGGIRVPEAMQGRSFWGRLAGGGYVRHEEIFTERNHHGDGYDPMRAVRTDKYHYIRNFDKLAKKKWLPSEVPYMNKSYKMWHSYLWPAPSLPRDQEELYDMQADPEEFNNLALCPDLKEVKDTLAAKLDQWMAQTSDPLLEVHEYE